MDTIGFESFPKGIRVGIGGGAEDELRASLFGYCAYFIDDFFKPLACGAGTVELVSRKDREENRWEERAVSFVFELGEDSAVEFPAGGGDCCVGDIGS